MNFIAIDLETTGLDFKTDRIIEIALAKYSEGKVIETYSQVIQPEMEVRDFILKLTSIPAEEIQAAPLAKEILPQVLEFIGDLPIIAHNAHFDRHFLLKTCDELQIERPKNAFLDTLYLSRLAWHNATNHKLETLVKKLDIKLENAHRALPDAIACGEVFLKALHEVNSWDIQTQEQVFSLTKGSDWDTIWQSTTTSEFHFSLNSQPESAFNSPASLPEKPSEWLEPQGVFSTPEQDFLPRRGQKKMADSIYQSFQDNHHLAVEAGTGVGKTLSYLSAASLWASKTQNRVLLSVSTKIQQEQVWQKELPKLQAVCGNSLKPAILKGRGSYISLHKVNSILNDVSHLSEEERLHCTTLIPWLQKTTTGDISENMGFNAGRNRILWQKLCCDSTDPIESDCYFQLARKKAGNANLLLVNHALFFKDMELDFGLLPAWEYVVFDEAHNIPKNAQSHLHKKVWFYGLRNDFQLLYNPYKNDIGLLHSLVEQFTEKPDLKEHCDALIGSCKALEKSLHRYFMKLGKQIRKQAKGHQIRFQGSLALEHSSSPESIFEATQICLTKQTVLQEYIQDFASPLVKQTLQQFQQHVEDFLADLMFITEGKKEDWVYWVEEPGNPHKLKLCASPLNVASEFKTRFFPWVKSAIFTSATLSVGGKFDYFKNQIGLSSKVKTQIWDTPFDLEQQRNIFCAQNIPKPNDPKYQSTIDHWLSELLPSNDKSSLVLYTSVSSLMNSHKELLPHFSKRLLLGQHIDGNMENLVNIAKNHEKSCILGTQVFWEGVDLPGEALEFLVISKLPFPNPSDPLVKATSEALEAQGKSAFADYMVPEAILELRQGLGRLIRTPTDSGTVLILDPRVAQSGYGHHFSRIWNKKHTNVSNPSEVTL